MLRIRPATVADVPALWKMIFEFARFERLEHYFTVTEETLVRDGFGENPRFRVLLAEWDGQLAGYELVYEFYSSFAGRGLFLEDIYVREEFRGKGIGVALMAQTAAIAVREGFWGVRWEVLNWNQTAIDFYKKLGATLQDGWRTMDLDEEPLRRLAERAGK